MMQSADAETLALKALAFLASSEDVLTPFLITTGMALADLRRRAGDPDVLAAVLDFCLASDTLLSELAASLGVDVLEVHAARRALPGGVYDP